MAKFFKKGANLPPTPSLKKKTILRLNRDSQIKPIERFPKPGFSIEPEHLT